MQVSNSNHLLLSTATTYYRAYLEAQAKLDIAIARCDELMAEWHRAAKTKIEPDAELRRRMEQVTL